MSDIADTSPVDSGGDSDSNADGTISIAGLLADDGAPVSELGQEVLAKMSGDDANDSGDVQEEEAPEPAAKAKPDPKKPDEPFAVAKVKGKQYAFKSKEDLLAAAQRGIAIQQNNTQEKTELQAMRQEVETMKATLRQQIDFLQSQKKALDETPEEFLRRLPNSEAVAEKLLIEKAKRWEMTKNMTPRERELFEQHEAAQAKLKTFEESQKKEAATRQEKLIEEQKEQIASIFGKALAKGNLPANTTTIRTMANIMRAAANKGVKLTEDQAAQLTKTQLQAIAKDSFGAMKPEDLIRDYPELAEGIRKHYVALARGEKQPTSQQKTVTPKPRPRTEEGKFKADKDMDPWEKELEKLKEQGRIENRKNNVYGNF